MNRSDLSFLIATSLTKVFRFAADLVFQKRYGHRAIVLETIAGVPGMVAGMLTHLQSLRKLDQTRSDLIALMLSEAENERQHLMFFIDLVQPSKLERGLIVAAQLFFWHFYLALYVFAPRTAHLMISMFEEQAVISYTSYIQAVESGTLENVHAPQSAIEYYNLNPHAKLIDMLRCIRDDEARHQEENMNLSLSLYNG